MHAAGSCSHFSAFVRVDDHRLQLLAESRELLVLLSLFQHVGANPTISLVQSITWVFTQLDSTDSADIA